MCAIMNVSRRLDAPTSYSLEKTVGSREVSAMLFFRPRMGLTSGHVITDNLGEARMSL